MLGGGTPLQPTPHLVGLASPQPADQDERPGDHGSNCHADAVVDRGLALFRRCFAIPTTSLLGAVFGPCPPPREERCQHPTPAHRPEPLERNPFHEPGSGTERMS